jgi:hypothetical protein
MSSPGVGRDGVRCVRPGCSHGYGIHAPGGGGCLYWFPLSGEHCRGSRAAAGESLDDPLQVVR